MGDMYNIYLRGPRGEGSDAELEWLRLHCEHQVMNATSFLVEIMAPQSRNLASRMMLPGKDAYGARSRRRPQIGSKGIMLRTREDRIIPIYERELSFPSEWGTFNPMCFA